MDKMNDKRWEQRRFFKGCFGGLMIYGYEDDSPFKADNEDKDAMEKEGFIYGKWFSTAAPYGEIGSNHISKFEEISKEEFERVSF